MSKRACSAAVSAPSGVTPTPLVLARSSQDQPDGAITCAGESLPEGVSNPLHPICTLSELCGCSASGGRVKETRLLAGTSKKWS